MSLVDLRSPGTARRVLRAAVSRFTPLAVAGMAGLALLAGPTWASDTPDPSAVTFAGSFQEELGCPGDWQPECAVPRLDFDAEDGIWQGTFDFPAGSWEYKAALNGAWDENYGANATRNGSNLSLNLAAAAPVKLYYDHETHWATSNRSATIVTAAGSFQSELGCPGDWQPDCLRSWLQDPDGDGIYTFRTRSLPAGNYEVKAAVDEGWAENYGAGGVSNGPNIAFSVSASCAETVFSFDDSTKVLTVSAGGPPEQPDFVTIPGSFQQELGCPGDWQPDCADTHLTYDDADGIWQGTFDVPAGSWEYKAAIDNAWDENYGANATRGGGNLSLNLSEAAAVKFYYDHGTHWVTSNRNAVIATAAGSFQSELGCPGDWQPDCLRSWLQDPDGDGLYTFTTRSIQAGSYEVKVAINESWSENYGAGGARDGANIGFTVPSDCTEVFFQYDAVSHILTVSAQGAPRGNISRAQAHWVLEDTFAWNVGAVPAGAVATLHYAPDGGLTLESTGIVAGGGGSSITLVQDPAGLPQEVKDKFPHLAGYAAFKIPAASLGLVPQILQGQIAISLAAADGTLIDATGLQIPGVLDDLYTYEGELGVVWDGPVPTLRVWAPTARSVKVLVYDSSRAAAPSGTFAMSRNAQGVWSYTGDANWLGKYYVYEVEVFVRTTGQVETNRVTDPYSLSLSRNSQRTQIVRLDDASLKPAGWDALVKPRLDAFEDITLYELHVRDFSASAPTVPEALQGTFKAFALPGANGMRHLAALARAGLTHVHLLPAFDIATIDEDKNQWRQPEGDLAAFPPDSEEQQARVEAVADLDPFNWGYDPWHFTVPEGSYSTNPDGGTRVAEFREMVQGLSNAGLRVVMDVVYNHTNAAGQNDKSVFDRIVPGYYHRLNADGNVETSTCCQNTASEHNMMEKLLIDSVVTWARDYKVDGFRFDLMGHHMKRNMIKLRQALDALTLEEDGVDGARVYLYGEGWNFGEVANNARGVNATQLNMAGTGIGTFSDRLRDGVRGGGPFSGLQEQGFLTGLFYDPNATDQGSGEDQKNRLLLYSDWIRVGLAGNLADYELIDRNGNLVRGREIDYNGQPAGYTADPQEVITYIEAHDNETLFDAIQMKAPVATSMADRVRMQNLGMSIVGFGQGIPFFHAGVELLRSKSLDRNSYNSGDWFNKLDFTYQDNNWGVGLPPARDNQSNWPILQPLLANPALEAAPGDIADALAHFEEVLAIRRSSPLFRLRTAAQVEEHLSFHNTGPGQVPGVIVMDLADAEGEVDRQHTRIVVVINATDETQGLTVPALQGVSLRLHPIQAGSNDPVVRTAAVSSLGTFTVPARTGAVFWAERPRVDQIDLLIADVEALAPVIGGGRANALAA
ncbi:MAG TPA: pullulanase-type alpha-1,6-glucosidase, partial [Thermoanaerobaculia bacterium]|nr:pullulanase-type alpha-1,6-glucosidase [Thermoanaerobaculia bacterium]